MQNFMRSILLIISLNLAIFWPAYVVTAMSSSNYQIRFETVGVGVGGSASQSSDAYTVRGSLEYLSGSSTSTSYRVDQGYYQGVYDPAVHFNVVSQDTASQVAATSISSASVVVTAITGYAVNDYIVVIQNEGLTQTEAMGRITSISGFTLNVDFFQYASSLPVIDGSNDFVYERRQQFQLVLLVGK
jgi:hypothetical protein